MNKKRIIIPEQELIELREKKKLSYERIAQYYRDKGIDVSFYTIRNRCIKIYGNKENVPTSARTNKFKPKKELPEEEIYQLVKEGKSFEEIRKYLLTEKQIKVCSTTIKKRCAEIFKRKGEEIPSRKNKSRQKRSTRREQASDEEIKEQIEMGLSQQEIWKHFKEIGKKATQKRIKEMFRIIKKDKKALPAKKADLSDRKNVVSKGEVTDTEKVSDEEIEELVKMRGSSPQRIWEHFRKIGKRVTKKRIIDIFKRRIREEQDMEDRVKQLMEELQGLNEQLNKLIKEKCTTSSQLRREEIELKRRKLLEEIKNIEREYLL